MQNILNKNREEKIELLYGLTLGIDDNVKISPLSQVMDALQQINVIA